MGATIKLVCTVALFVLLILPQSSEQNDIGELEDIFVATKEWQVVRKGQKIPKGLHVRINFETGVTEAKLLDKTETDTKLSAVTIPEKLDVLNEFGKIESDKQKPKQFKSYDEIKKDLRELNLSPKSDGEVMKGFFDEYKANAGKNIDRSIAITEDLENLAHQYDNGLEFVRLQGFNEIIYKNLNSSSNELKAVTLILLGSLAQNNPKVQIHAIETGSLHILQRLIGETEKNKLGSKVVFALGSILRRFPWAQSKFMQSGGLETLYKSLTSDDLKLRIKIVTLLNDLITEKKQAKETASQYENINIITHLKQLNYCEDLNITFGNLLAVDKTDVDSIGKCLDAMVGMIQECKGNYSGAIIRQLINYKGELNADHEDERDLIDTISKIFKDVHYKNEL